MVNVDSRYDSIRKIFSYSEDTDQDDEFVLSHEMVRHSVLNKVDDEVSTNEKKGHGNLGYFVMSHKNKEPKKQLRGSGSNDADLEAIRREVNQRLAQFEEPIKEVKKKKEEEKQQNQHMVEEEESVKELKKANLNESQSIKEEKKQKQFQKHDKENKAIKEKLQRNKKDNDNNKKEKKLQTVAVESTDKDVNTKEEKQLVQQTTPQANFLSFDLGGSGLKFLPLYITEEEDTESGIPVKRARPVGAEVNLGRLPVAHYKQPREWIEKVVKDELGLKSIKDWPDFALSGRANTYKLFSGKEVDTIYGLTNTTNSLDMACKDISTTDVPEWASKKISFWCNKWRPASEILGFSDASYQAGSLDDVPNFRGAWSDGRAHFEGARAKLQQISPSRSDSTTFATFAFGTGHSIWWTNTTDKADNITASGSPLVYDKEIIPAPLSFTPTNHTHLIQIGIPKKVLDNDITLQLDGYKKKMEESMPIWMILDGAIWNNPSITHDDIREIYKHFFRTQVLSAIDSGKLLKPEAIVFSGGQQEHFNIAQMLSSITKKQGIKMVGGFNAGSHCGNARLSYNDTFVDCNFGGGSKPEKIVQRKIKK